MTIPRDVGVKGVVNLPHGVYGRVPASKVARKMHRKVHDVPRLAVDNDCCHSFRRCPTPPFPFPPIREGHRASYDLSVESHTITHPRTPVRISECFASRSSCLVTKKTGGPHAGRAPLRPETLGPGPAVFIGSVCVPPLPHPCLSSYSAVAAISASLQLRPYPLRSRT